MGCGCRKGHKKSSPLKARYGNRNRFIQSLYCLCGAFSQIMVEQGIINNMASRGAARHAVNQVMDKQANRSESEDGTNIARVSLPAYVRVAVGEVHDPSEDVTVVGTALNTRPVEVGLYISSA